MKLLISQFTGNVLALALQEISTATASVVRDADGIPQGWRLFRYGPFSLTQDGQPLSGEFRPVHARAIIAYAQAKGTTIPIDTEHNLKLIADEIGVDEAELVKLLRSSRYAIGNGSLSLRDDGLWLESVKWTPIGRRIMAAGLLRYFSPVLRGLKDGRLRLTSVAITNTPALDQLDELVARAESDPDPVVSQVRSTAFRRSPSPSPSLSPSPNANKKGPAMNELLTLIAKLAGVDAVALADDGKAPAEVLAKLQALAEEVPSLRKANTEKSAFLSQAKDALALTDTPTLDLVHGKLLALVETGKGAIALADRVKALEADATKRERAALIGTALADGKLTPALVEKWANQADVATLRDFLAAAPVIVPQGKTVDRKDLKPSDSVVMSDIDNEVARNCGLDPKEVAEAWKRHQAAL